MTFVPSCELSAEGGFGVLDRPQVDDAVEVGSGKWQVPWLGTGGDQQTVVAGPWVSCLDRMVEVSGSDCGHVGAGVEFDVPFRIEAVVEHEGLLVGLAAQ